MSDTSAPSKPSPGANLVRAVHSLLEWLLVTAIYLACGGALYVLLYDEPVRLGVWFWSFVFVWPLVLLLKFSLYVLAIFAIVAVILFLVYLISEKM